jgi:NADPH:quinone reductase-like Zn-dependent oxidoreductase
MKAAWIEQWGQPLQIKDLPEPTPGDDEVLVRVKASSVNGVDISVAAGHLQQMLTAPMVPGTDFAGDVVAVGAKVTHIQPGQAVYGFVPIRGGTFAQYAVVKANEVAPKPQSLDYLQAATVPLVALTAWQCLFDLARLQGGERVLIQGAGGGVGSFAVQFARERRAYVIAVDGPEKQSFLDELGVDEKINYREQRFEEVVSEVDVVLDTVRGSDMERLFKVLKPGGRLVTTVAQPSQEEAARRGVQVFGAFAQANSEQFRQVAELLDAGKLRVFVQQVFPLEQVQAAYELYQTGMEPGKVAVSID